MIIPVKIDKVAEAIANVAAKGENEKSGISVPQWSMVELQGELISKEPLSGQALGSVTIENVSREP